MRICLVCGGEVEDAGGMDVGGVGGGYIRGLQSCKLYKSDIHLSGGARGTFCHISGRRSERDGCQGECQGECSVRASVVIAHQPLDADGGGCG